MSQAQPSVRIYIPKRTTRDKLIALIAMRKKDINTVICDLIDAADIPGPQPPAPTAPTQPSQPKGKRQ